MISLKVNSEAVLLPVFSVICALLLFGLFVAIGGHSPVEVWILLFKGAFGDAFSIQNTMQRAAPLMMTALCVAIPARAGLTIIGGEGALVLGALACSALPYAVDLPSNTTGTVLVLLSASIAGGLWIGLAGWMRQRKHSVADSNQELWFLMKLHYLSELCALVLLHRLRKFQD